MQAQKFTLALGLHGNCWNLYRNDLPPFFFAGTSTFSMSDHPSFFFFVFFFCWGTIIPYLNKITAVHSSIRSGRANGAKGPYSWQGANISVAEQMGPAYSCISGQQVFPSWLVIWNRRNGLCVPFQLIAKAEQVGPKKVKISICNNLHAKVQIRQWWIDKARKNLVHW